MNRVGTEILPRLFLGTREDAEALGALVPLDWTCISVTEYRAIHGKKEELPREPHGAIDLPFMLSGIKNKTNRADSAMLDVIAEKIWQSTRLGKKTLVHCVHAHERSPLAIAWYLVRLGKAPNIISAYAMIQKVHPSAERRDAWLTSQPTPWILSEETERLRECLRYLRLKIEGHDAAFASCGFEEFGA